MSEPRSEYALRLEALRADVDGAIEQAEAACAAYEAIDIAHDLLSLLNQSHLERGMP